MTDTPSYFKAHCKIFNINQSTYIGLPKNCYYFSYQKSQHSTERIALKYFLTYERKLLAFFFIIITSYYTRHLRDYKTIFVILWLTHFSHRPSSITKIRFPAYKDISVALTFIIFFRSPNKIIQYTYRGYVIFVCFSQHDFFNIVCIVHWIYPTIKAKKLYSRTLSHY